MTEAEYPEHAKLQLVKERSQSIGEFLDWLPSQGISLMTWMEEDVEEPCTWCDGEGVACHNRSCNDGTVTRHYEGFFHARQTIHDLLATYFEIDRDKLEAEKEAMLDRIRALNRA